uniref:DUF4220 domain-containing protein n=1 Tax=Davidia involucrata TaxID=16924 RepID=A0A5B6YPC7_DAVIN
MDPIPAWVKSLWAVWDVRMLIVFSLIIQTILFILGKRRKYIPKFWIQITVWCAYLVADWVATVALGKLSDVDADDKNNNIALGGIWAPLLLLHLGGPDTITAYSVDDNQLWLRHFLGLFVQATVAIYVFLMSWSSISSWFSYLAFLVFVAGIIKYGERTWVLKSGCDTQQEVPFANVIKEVVLRISASPDAEALSKLLFSAYPDAEVFVWANQIVDVYKPHIENYVASIEDATALELVLNPIEDGLKYLEAIDVEMGLMYDLLYTKAAITYTKLGCILRSISFSCTVSVFLGFFYLITMEADHHMKNREEEHYYNYSIKVDIAITCALLVGAFVLEMYGIIVLLSSDWTMLWLIKQYPKCHQLAAQSFGKFPWLFSKCKQRRWSNSMGQFNLLSFSLKDKDKDKKPMKLIINRKLFRNIEEELDKYWHETCEVVPGFLKENIAEFILSHNWDFTKTSDKEALDHDDSRGITRLDFDEKIIIWHIATQVWYHHHHHQDSHTITEAPDTSSSTVKDYKETCKLVSDYMVYLLVMCPFMLPIKKDDVVFRDAVTTLKVFFEEKGVSVEDEAYLKLEQEKDPDNILIGKAQILIKKLLGKKNGKWRILSCVWMEIICHAAKESQQNNHARQLGRGGELLTWVWLFLTQSVKSGKVELIKKELQVWDYEKELQNWDSYISNFLNKMECHVNRS